MTDKSNIGVALTKCYYCNKNDRILMNTRLTPTKARQVETAHGKVIDMEPCNECSDLMKKGIILLTIDPEKSSPSWEKESIPNPYRTGGFFVVTEDFCKRVFPPVMFEWARKHRFMYIEHKAAEGMGLFQQVMENTGIEGASDEG